MIHSVDFKEMAGKISYIDIVKYLKDIGWIEIASKRKYVKSFQLYKMNDLFQVDIPTIRELRDYNNAMFNAVENIAMSVEKSTEQVLLELLNPLSDIIRVRIKTNIEEESEYIGKICKLQSTPDVEKRTHGKATLVFIGDNDAPVKASMNLSKEEYDLAIQAHESGSYVKVTGLLSGIKTKTINCTKFEIIL